MISSLNRINYFQTGWMSHFVDVFVVWQRWIVAAVFLVVHCLIVFLLPVPGCPTGKNISTSYA